MKKAHPRRHEDRQDAKRLRAAAQAQLDAAPASLGSSTSVESLVHELQVHQIELEMQNEQLRIALNALEESRDQYLDLYDFAPVGYFSLSADGYICQANLTSARMFRREPQQLLGRRFATFVVAAERDYWRQFLRERIESGGVGTTELHLLRADGDVLHAQLECDRRLPPAGETVLRVSLSDISERKKTAALVESEERLRLALEAANQSWFDIDMGSGKMTVSPGLARAIGVDLEGIETDLASWLEQVHPDDRAALSSALRISVAGTESVTVEYRRHTSADQWQWLRMDCKGVRRDVYGLAARIIGVKTDISERKQAEIELDQYRNHLEALVAARTEELTRSREAAEAANRAKGVFLATMSHELRSPLNGIFGMTELAMQIASDPRQIRWLKSSLDAAEHLHAVINDVLDLSQIEADRLVLVSRDFALRETVEQAVQMQQAAAKAKGLSLSWEVDSSLPELLNGDALRLRQILINLSNNAVKFSDQGYIGVHVTAAEQDDRSVLMRIEVSDQGVGISAEAQARLFQPFVQVDGSMSRRYAGSGLGLAISKRLAQLMGGDIGVTSVEGQGSRFWVTARFSCATQREPVDPGVTEPARETVKRLYAGARVLVVEDEPVSRELMLVALQDAGLVVELASNGQEAVTMASGGNYSLILMDCQMMLMNGFEATVAIRALPGMSDTPILAVTANAFDEDRDACLAAGMNDHIRKPLALATLFATLLRWLPQTRAPLPESETTGPSPFIND